MKIDWGLAVGTSLGEFCITRTVLFIVVVIVLWELFEYGIETLIKKVCNRPYNEDEYPW